MFRWRLLFIAASFGLFGCSGAETAGGSWTPPDVTAASFEPHWPGDRWESVPPADVGIDPAGLADLVEAILAEDLQVHSLLVVRRGRLAFEAYAWPFHRERAHDVASVTKSVTGTLVGIALGEGSLPGLDAPLATLLPVPGSAAPGDVTLRHLLTMTSGLECVTSPGEQTLMEMIAAEAPLVFALQRRPVAPVGQRWCYDSAGAHLLAAATARAVGDDLAGFAQSRLFAPIGIGESAWPALQGVRRGWGDLRLRPRDMARLGLLYLYGGRWNGRQVLPGEWVAAATRDQIGAIFGRPEHGYGFLWWPDRDGAFHAAGRGGQYVYVFPAADLVVVTTASESRKRLARFGTLLRRHLQPALRPDAGPMAAHPDDEARLARAAMQLASAPAARAIPPAPETAMAIAGRTIGLAPNPYGWKYLVFHFQPGAAAVDVRFEDGGRSRLAVGLDGVPRVSRGVRYATDERHADGQIVLDGIWEDERTFALRFDTLDRIDRGSIAFRFPGDDTVEVSVHEVTLMEEPAPIAAGFVELAPSL